jgi:hypothetical protein
MKGRTQDRRLPPASPQLGGRGKQASSEPRRPGPAVRTVASVLLVGHLVAVVAAPLAVQPSSPLFGGLWLLCRPYLEAANLNHGYHFFAPDPGPSPLVRYEVELADGTLIKGIFPDRHAHWPRLLYHRHFMLADRLPPGPSGGQEASWKEGFARSYAEHLYHKHDARRVTLWLQNHLIPFPDQVQEGIELDDPRLYQERPLTEYRGEWP